DRADYPVLGRSAAPTTPTLTGAASLFRLPSRAGRAARAREDSAAELHDAMLAIGEKRDYFHDEGPSSDPSRSYARRSRLSASPALAAVRSRLRNGRVRPRPVTD